MHPRPSAVPEYHHTIFKFYGVFNGKEEGFAKPTQVMLLEGLSDDDVTAEAYPVSIKLESLLRRYSWDKVPQKYIYRISYGRDARRRRQIHRFNR